eukprot:m.31234 g.31234  ORF g.31234 m.31234 type:complete len:170 (-) comp12049_c0_seq4:1679-2188(-)
MLVQTGLDLTSQQSTRSFKAISQRPYELKMSTCTIQEFIDKTPRNRVAVFRSFDADHERDMLKCIYRFRPDHVQAAGLGGWYFGTSLDLDFFIEHFNYKETGAVGYYVTVHSPKHKAPTDGDENLRQGLPTPHNALVSVTYGATRVIEYTLQSSHTRDNLLFRPTMLWG